MSNDSFLKGYCPKFDQYYRIQLRKFQGEWKVIDFSPMNKETAKLLASLVEQDSFCTNENILPCQYSSTRKICSCNKVPCPKKAGAFSGQCIYCDKMEIDYSNDLSDTQFKEGDVIRLEQGQEVKIALGGKSLEAIELNVGWDPATGLFHKEMDIDSSIILYAANQSKSSELVFFGKKEDEARSVFHHGDNLTGRPVNGQSDVDEIIDVKLSAIPSKYNHVAVVINIFDCNSRFQTFKSVNNLFIRLYDKKTHKEILGYQVSHDISRDTGLVIGLLKRTSNGWTFKASGDSYKVKDVHELKDKVISKY